MYEDIDTTDLLADLLGFKRHERLDVKKPGPQSPIPLEDHPAINASKSKSNSNEADDNGLGFLPKIKKVMHLEGDDHAPHSVDSQFAHIIVKTP